MSGGSQHARPSRYPVNTCGDFGSTIAPTAEVQEEIEMVIEPWLVRATLAIVGLCTGTGALVALNTWLERRNSL